MSLGAGFEKGARPAASREPRRAQLHNASGAGGQARQRTRFLTLTHVVTGAHAHAHARALALHVRLNVRAGDLDSLDLPAPNWDALPLPLFEKRFLVETPAVAARGAAEVAAFRASRAIAVDGDDVPKPVTSFDEAPFPAYVRDELRKAGFAAPTPIQAQGWPCALSGRDLIAVAGGMVTAPPVPELPQTLWERAESGGGDTFDRWLTIARGSAYTILAVVGVWGLFTALSSLRRVKLVERTLVDPQTEREAEAQTEAAAEVEEHGRQDGDDMHEHEAAS